ncbi:MAG: hypothetical protein E7456_05475 [Ruminococcaceae bacterium]|nr:hypothetical protein [Oscillospiraceae bacterium]
MKTARKILASLLALVMIICMLPATVVASSDQAHKDLAREAVGEGLVLLKNDDNALPLASNERVALFGGGQIYTASTSNGYQIGGGGSGWVNMDYTPDGPAEVLAEMVDVYEPLTAAYEANISYVPDAAMYDAAAAYADTAIMFMTRYSTEGSDISTANWYLSAAETSMLENLSSRFENVVVLVNAPSMIATDWSVDGNTEGIDVDALLICYMGGEMGAYGMADVLTGAVNPSGKLVDTYAYDLYDYPTTETFLESNAYVRYTEDIYVGYRYFETFAPEKVVYEFGYGLSYTDFEIKTNSVTADNGVINVNVTVTNTGDTAGKEVVQVYYSAPQAGEGTAKLSKSAIVLGAYDKTDLIQPGASQTMDISYPINDMASFDDTGLSGNQSAYVLEAGTYDILVGNSAKNNAKAGEYTVVANTVTEQLTQLCETNLDVRMNAKGEYDVLNETGPAATVVFPISATEVSVVETENYTGIIDPNESNDPRVENYNGYFFDGTKWRNTGSGQCMAFAHTLVGSAAAYKINVEKAGTYRMAFAAADGGTDNTNVEDVVKIYTLIDGVRTYSDIKYDVTNTYYANTETGGQWYNFLYAEKDFQENYYYIDLPAGEYELCLEYQSVVSQTNLNFDKFWIIPEGVEYGIADAVAAYPNIEYPELNLDMDKDDYKGIKYSDVLNGEATIDEFLAQMSLNEMIDLTSGHTTGVTSGTGSIGPSSDATAEKYGIFTADTADGPAGIRLSTYFATYWPCSTLQACTWNTDLIEEVGQTVGKEALQSMVDIWLAPGMNIHRSPLCGRNFEYYSEDPLVTGKSAAALTKGVESTGVAVTLKHFCVNNKEGNRNSSDSRVSEKALREIYLKGFEIACKEADPEFIMTSYNYLNGIETSENYDLLHGIVRFEWGWDGAFMTDWGNNSSIVAEINAGNNVKMSTGNLDEVRTAVDKGIITRETLEENTMYILNALSNCPDFAINQYKVHELAATGGTFIHATDFSRKSYHSRYEKVTALNELCTTYAQNTDADGHALYLEFTVDSPTYAVYTLDLNYANNTAQTNVFEVYVNGQLVEGLDNDAPATGAWTTYVYRELGKINLPQGKSTIRIQHINANGINYRGIRLTPEDAIEVGSNDGAYGETVNIPVYNNLEGLTSVVGTMECDVTLVDVRAADEDVMVFYNPESGVLFAYKIDGSEFDVGEVIFQAYFRVDKLAAQGYENGDIPVGFNITEATVGENTLDVCFATPGYLTIDTVYEPGDVNGDGMITNIDVIMVARHIIHLATLNDAQIARADVDGTGSIQNSDLVKIARMVVGG